MTLNGFSEYLQRTSGSGLTVRTYLPDAQDFASFLDGLPPSVEAVERWTTGDLPPAA